MKRYCILDERWIDIIGQPSANGRISVREFFQNAQHYKRFDFATVREEISTLRFMLAILHTVVQRYDLDGTESFLETPQMAIERWGKIWESGELPYQVINDYLDQHEDAFYLIHDTNPFMQELWMQDKEKFKINFSGLHNDQGEIPSSKKGIFKNASISTISPRKFLPSVASSNNKSRILSTCDSMSITDTITLAQAVPALLTLHCYDDNAVKPGTGPGWMSLSTTTFIEGNNLFETVMLNLQLLDYNGNVWPANKPSWEDKPNITPRVEPITVPNNPAEILSMHYRSSRLLVNDNDEVYGIISTAGCYFDKANVFAEPMKILELNQKTGVFKAKYLWSAEYSWRDFPTIFQNTDKYIIPSLTWLQRLKIYGKLDNQRYFQQVFFNITYDSKRMAIVNTVVKPICMYWNNFEKTADIRMSKILLNEIENCNKLISAAKTYIRDLCLSYSLSLNKKDKPLIEARQNEFILKLYSAYDVYIRQFATDLSTSDNIAETRKAFRRKMKATSDKYCKDLPYYFSPLGFIGRLQSDSNGKQEYYSYGKAMSSYSGKIYGILMGDYDA